MAAGDEDGKLSVPKFSSFKPKEPSPKPSSEPRRERKRDDTGDKDERGHRHGKHRHGEHHHGEHHHDEHRHGGHHHGEHRHRSQPRRRDAPRRDRSPRTEDHRRSRDHRSDRAKPVSDKGSASSVPGLFVIDKKGDPLIRKYGLDRSKIPPYRRYGGNRVLGTNGRLVFHQDGSREKFSLLFPGERSAGVRDRGGLRSGDWLRRVPVRLRTRRSERVEDDDAGDYLCLENPRKRRRRHGNSDESEGEDRTPWRSIEGKAKADSIGGKTKADSDEESDGSLSGSGAADRDDPLRWKSTQLNRRVKDHPDDIDAWLELVDHQDALLPGGGTFENSTAENTAHSFAEIKVHLLESALAHASRPVDRHRVLVALMREGVKIWNRKVASKKWAQIADDERHSFALWKTHLDYSMSSIATVQFEDIKNMMIERLHQVCSRSGLESREEVAEAIYIFLRATRFFHDAGYKELAVAAWQGLLELNMFRPERAESQAETLAAFRDFWESEEPRLGDAGARGWRHCAQGGGPDDAPERVANEEPAGTPPQDPYDAWAAAERLCGRRALMPARTMDADIDDDPFRVVMHSDIEPLLFLIPEGNTVNGLNNTQQLIDAFLLFCGLPPAFRSSEWTETAWDDQYVARPRVSLRLQPARDIDAQDQDGPKRRPPSFGNGNCRARMSDGLLFGGSSWFQYFDVASEEHMVDLSWVETTLKQLVHSAKISSLALYYLGLCFARKRESVRKQARALLKQYPAEVRLFNGYALAEFANGNGEVADKVLASALESPALASASTGFLLFKTWSWIELQRGDTELATKRLCACVDDGLRGPRARDGPVAPSTILRARQVFAENGRRWLYEGDQETASSHMECLALLSYLTDAGGSEPASTSQGNISAAMEAFASISSDVQFLGRKCEAAHELMLQSASRMLYFHSTRGPFRRAYMREQLARFADAFPRNTVFLGLFAWADAGAWVVDETRQLLADKALARAHDSVSGRAFAVGHELERGNANSARAALERAVASDACGSSVALWLSYVRLCRGQRRLRAGAGAVLWQALGRCPWSKELMMEAFGGSAAAAAAAAGGLGPAELRSVYEAMTSKGLRVHVDLDGFLADFARRRG